MMKHEKNPVEQKIKDNNLFSEFLSFLEYMFCARCWYERQGKFDRSCWHTKGSMLYLLSKGKKVDKNHFAKWQNESMARSVVDAFGLFLEMSKREKPIGLVGQIYDAKSYADASMDVESAFYSVLFGDLDGQDGSPVVPVVAGSFSSMVLKIINARNDLWISHISEHGFLKIDAPSHKTNYPEFFCRGIDPKYWSPGLDGEKMAEVEDTSRCFACHVDTFRPDSCHWHIFNFFKKENGWQTVMGVMTKDDFLLTGNEICVAPASMTGRDHPYGRLLKPVSKDKWIFIFHDPSDLNCLLPDVGMVFSFSCLNKLMSVLSLMCVKAETFKVK